MLIKLYFTQFFNDVKNQKLRVFLTLFGLIWGTTAIMLLLAFGQSLTEQMYKNMHGMGERICIFWGGRTSLPYAGYSRGRNITLYREDAEKLKKNIPELKYVCGETSTGSMKLRYKDKEVTLDLTGVEYDWNEMRNVIPQTGGRFIHPDDVKKRKRVVFLGNELKKNVYGDEDVVGKHAVINGIPFLIIGVMKPKIQSSSYSGRDHDKAIIPITTLQTMIGGQSLNNIIFQPREGTDNQYVKRRVKELMASIKKFDPNDPDVIPIWDTSDMDKFTGYLTTGLQIFLGVIGFFTIVVAAIGVANIMNIVVEERTREIGIKLALGMKRRTIFNHFLLETFLLTLVGGIIGFLISNGACAIANQFPIEEAVGSPQVTLFVGTLTIIILGTVAFFAGFFPARKAASLHPVEALRW